MKYKVWIELPEHNQKAHAELATNMLHRCGYNQSVKIWWNEKKQQYCLRTGGPGDFIELPDKGHWFDLELMAGGS